MQLGPARMSPRGGCAGGMGNACRGWRRAAHWLSLWLLVSAAVHPPRRVSAQVAEPATVERARELTGRGSERFERGDYQAAVAAFLEAHELLAGDARQPTVLHNIALCYERLFRYDLARRYYQRFLEEGAPSAEDRREIEQIVAGLSALLGEVAIETNLPATLWVDGQIEIAVPAVVELAAGEHTLEVTAEGHVSQRRQVRVVPRSQMQLAFTLEPEPVFLGVHRSYFWTAASVAAASLVVGAGFGGRAVALDRRYDAAHAVDARSVSQVDSDQIKRLQRGADVAFGSAALFATAAIVLGFVTDWDARREARGDTAGRLRFAPAAFARGGGLAMQGALR